MVARPAGLLLAGAALLSCFGSPSLGDGPGGIVGESSGATINGPVGQVYSMLDYFDSGRRAVQLYVASAPRGITEPRLGRTIDRAARVCVRIEVRFGRAASGYRSVSGSGVLIDRGRRVLTAGHTLEDLQDHDVIVTLPTGESRRARALEQDYAPLGGGGHDWAVLEIIGGGFRGMPDVEFAEADSGDLAIILGYPDQIGINAAGNLSFASGDDHEELHPLTTLGTVDQGRELTLRPRAGAIPTGGMSGGPVFDAHGRLLGIFVSIVRADGLGQPTYSFRATPMRSVRRLLNELGP